MIRRNHFDESFINALSEPGGLLNNDKHFGACYVLPPLGNALGQRWGPPTDANGKVNLAPSTFWGAGGTRWLATDDIGDHGWSRRLCTFNKGGPPQGSDRLVKLHQCNEEEKAEHRHDII